MRNFLIALSMANSLFLRAWEKVLFGNYLDDFKPDGPTVALLVFITGFGLWASWLMVRSSKRLAVFGQIVFLVLLILPANALRLYYQQSFRLAYGNRFDFLAILILAVLGAPIGFAIVTRRLRLRFLVHYGIFLVLALAPFTLFTVGRVLLNSFREATATTLPQSTPVAGPIPTQTWPAGNESKTKPKRPRLVWIIFDELDEHTAFIDRPPSVSMPELDRFRRESFVAASAYSPGSVTILSIPALLNGRVVASVQPRDQTFAITQEGDPGPVIWNAGMTVFAEASSAGIKPGLVGVFYPYCRILGSAISDCRDFRVRESLPKRVGRVLARAIDAVPFAFRLFLKDRIYQREIERYQFVLRNGSEVAVDPKLDLVYLHFPLPHPPGIYDRATGHLELTKKGSYLDNLALTDVTFGALRRAMEQAGVWDSSVVIVSADHWWRSEEVWKQTPDWTREEEQAVAGRAPDHRVPFIVKLCGNADPMVYEKPLNTLISRKMVMALLKGQLSTSKDLTAWLERQ